jgi:hypothetical protein
MMTLEQWFISTKNREDIPETAVVIVTSENLIADFKIAIKKYRLDYPFMKSLMKNPSDLWNFNNAGIHLLKDGAVCLYICSNGVYGSCPIKKRGDLRNHCVVELYIKASANMLRKINAGKNFT